MSSIVKSLYQLIRQCLTCEERLEPYKLTQKQISQVFIWLDQRRRSTIDVSDFYSKFSDLSETELFYVFKFLDSSSKGAITHQDLLKNICMKQSCNRQTQDDPKRCFMNIVRILKATFHLIQQQKKKLGLSSSVIQQIFNNATLMKKDKIDLKDLIILFKQTGLSVDEKIIIYLQNQIFKRNSLTATEFTSIFSPLKWESSSSTQQPLAYNSKLIRSYQQKGIPASYLTTKTTEKINNADKINSQIDKILKKYKNPLITQDLKLPGRSQIVQPRKSQNLIFKTGPQILQKDNYDIDQLLFSKNTTLGQRNRQQYKQIDQKKFDDIFRATTPNSSSFGQINRRRQQLRRGSLQRQKIMEDVRKMKVQFSETAHARPGGFYNPLRIQAREQPELMLYEPQRVSSPTYESTKNSSFQRKAYGKLYENHLFEKDMQILRPASATKSTNSFFDRNSYTKLNTYEHNLKPDLNQFYRRGTETPKNFTYEKENTLKRAEQEATKKIEQIQRRARLKVMQKRSATGVYNRWLK